MAHPHKDDQDWTDIGRANRDDDQHWSERGWRAIEGGRGAHDRDDVIGADYTVDPMHAPIDAEHLSDDAHRALKSDAPNTAWSEPLPERNYPTAYNRDDLMNADLNPMMITPPRTSASFKALAVVLGLCLFVLVALAMYWGWMSPAKRSPQRNGKATPTVEQPQHRGIERFAALVNRVNERRSQ